MVARRAGWFGTGGIAQEGVFQEVKIGLHVVGDFPGEKQLLLVELFLKNDFDLAVESLPKSIEGADNRAAPVTMMTMIRLEAEGSPGLAGWHIVLSP